MEASAAEPASTYRNVDLFLLAAGSLLSTCPGDAQSVRAPEPGETAKACLRCVRKEQDWEMERGALHFLNVPLNKSTPAVLIIVRR
jgi:hypothetical protein